jgi:putative flavoprotein involved in K+ transport
MNAMPTLTHKAQLDVLVIGGGQAGLAIGYHLAQRRLCFLIVDAGPAVGHVWRNRWDSLRLFTPAEYDALPGTPFPAPTGSHPTKDEVADYLNSYAKRHGLPVRLNTAVQRLHRHGGGFTAVTTTGTVHARQVVVATGPFQHPHTPSFANTLTPGILQLHSAQYRTPAQLPRGARVLVVGAANSGLQIADELAATHRVTVAVGSRPAQLPQRLLGRDLFFWLDRTGLMTKPATSRLARRIRSRGDLVIGTRISALRRRGVTFRPRLTTFTDHTAHFGDGTSTPVDAVVWATGYRSDYRWLHIPGVIADGQVQHDAGTTNVPGLYFLGLPWQTSRGSGLLGFVARDAASLADRLTGVDDVRDAREAEPRSMAGAS